MPEEQHIRGDVTPEWVVARSASVLRLLHEPPEGRFAPRQIPAFRSMPAQTERAISVLPITMEFETDRMPLRLDKLRIFPSGIAFRLIAMDESGTSIADEESLPNLSHRIRPNQRHRIRLVVDVPGAGMVTNAANLFAFPDEATAPWLVGGSNGASTTEGGIEVMANYFLSPVPDSPGEVVIAIAYPELGIEPCCVAIDSSVLTADEA